MLKVQSLILFLTLTTPILHGCGNLSNRSVSKALESSYNFNSGTSTLSSSSDALATNYTCPAQPNVLPDFDYNHDGTGQFTVCPHSSDPASILVRGIMNPSAEICIFPAQVIDAQHIYAKPDLQKGGLLVQCLAGSPQGVIANFQGVNYNAIFVANSADVNQMSNCIATGNYFACPHYSYGKFR